MPITASRSIDSLLSRWSSARQRERSRPGDRPIQSRPHRLVRHQQAEVNPYLTQDELRGFCAEHQIAVEAWSPLARGQVLGDPAIESIARRTGKTPAQVVLRWHIERGDIVFPKSVTPARIKENIDIFDFELSSADVEAISLLNRNERTGPDPDKFDGI